MIDNGFDLVFFMSVDDVRWGQNEVGSMLRRFSVRSQEASVEDIVALHPFWEDQLIRHETKDSLYFK